MNKPLVFMIFISMCIFFLLCSYLSVVTEGFLTLVSSHYNEDLKWLYEQDMEVVVCSKTIDSPKCPIDKNKGREASAYLKYIVDNYDDLPEHIAFLHGHQTAWHQKGKRSIISLIKDCAKYKEYDYISLNNYYWYDWGMDNQYVQYMHQIWDNVFRPYLKRDPPTYLSSDCCAQFIVSSDRIRKLPREAYLHWYNFIMNVDKKDDGGKSMGYVFEYLWHVIFGDADVVPYEEYKKRFRCGDL